MWTPEICGLAISSKPWRRTIFSRRRNSASVINPGDFASAFSNRRISSSSFWKARSTRPDAVRNMDNLLTASGRVFLAFQKRRADATIWKSRWRSRPGSMSEAEFLRRLKIVRLQGFVEMASPRVSTSSISVSLCSTPAAMRSQRSTLHLSGARRLAKHRSMMRTALAAPGSSRNLSSRGCAHRHRFLLREFLCRSLRVLTAGWRGAHLSGSHCDQILSKSAKSKSPIFRSESSFAKRGRVLQQR